MSPLELGLNERANVDKSMKVIFQLLRKCGSYQRRSVLVDARAEEKIIVFLGLRELPPNIV